MKKQLPAKRAFEVEMCRKMAVGEDCFISDRTL